MKFLDWLKGPTPLSILSALAIGAVLMVLAGSDPISGYAAMVKGSFGSGIGVANTLQRAVPIVAFGLAIALAFRAGVINLGTEGQAVLGALVGGIVALYMPGPAFLVTLVALAAGIATGALWALITAVLQNYLGVPILISTLLLNYPARYISSWMIRFKLNDTESDLIASEQFDPGTQIGMIVPRRSGAGEALANSAPRYLTEILTGVNWGFFVVVALIVFVTFLNRKTKYGFESGLAGYNAEFTRYGGVSAKQLVVKTMTLSGAIAGLAGMLIVLGAPNTRMIEGHVVQTNYAWTALLVTLLAMYRPIGVAIAGLFFAAIIVGSLAMGRELGMSPQISAVIQALVIILIVFQVTLPQFKKKKRPDETPTAADPHLTTPEGAKNAL